MRIVLKYKICIQVRVIPLTGLLGHSTEGYYEGESNINRNFFLMCRGVKGGRGF